MVRNSAAAIYPVGITVDGLPSQIWLSEALGIKPSSNLTGNIRIIRMRMKLDIPKFIYLDKQKFFQK